MKESVVVSSLRQALVDQPMFLCRKERTKDVQDVRASKEDNTGKAAECKWFYQVREVRSVKASQVKWEDGEARTVP
jgi:hypothetical protein